MYYIMRDINITKDGKVFLTAADSNISPRKFYEGEYASDEKELRTKLSLLFKSMLDGNIHPEGYAIRSIQETLRNTRETISRYAPDVSLDDDLAFGANRYSEMHKMVSELVGPPALLGEKIPYDEIAKKLPAFNKETKEIYSSIETRFKEEEIYVVSAASMSQVFPGYDVLFRPENNECIVCLRENYDNRGHLNNKDHSAIFLGGGSGDAFYCLCDTVGSEPNGPEVNWALLSDIPMARLPYKGFEPEYYNMTLTPELKEKLNEPITEDMVLEAYRKGIIRIDDAQKHLGDGICAVIEDNWFYFAGQEGENTTPEEYINAVPEEDIVREINEALRGIKDLDEDEYEYYRLVFKEHGIDGKAHALKDKAAKQNSKQTEKPGTKKGKTM